MYMKKANLYMYTYNRYIYSFIHVSSYLNGTTYSPTRISFIVISSSASEIVSASSLLIIHPRSIKAVFDVLAKSEAFTVVNFAHKVHRTTSNPKLH